jgi:hypothetical protein
MKVDYRPAFSKPSLGYPDVAYGSLADKLSRAKIGFCPLWSKSGQILRRSEKPRCAIKNNTIRIATKFTRSHDD